MGLDPERLDQRLALETESVAVTNTTRELRPGDLPLMFERLWRKDVARSSQHHGGLGLSLAKACAHQLGVEIRPSLDAGGRLTMTLSGIVESPPGPTGKRAQRSAGRSAPFSPARLGTT